MTASAFALSTLDGRLTAFPSIDTAEVRCAGAEVEKGMWLFFSEDGSPLEVRFRRPANGNLRSPARHLGPVAPGTSRPGEVGERLCLTSLPELIELLKVNRGKRAARGI
jgi:hypothetical protein